MIQLVTDYVSPTIVTEDDMVVFKGLEFPGDFKEELLELGKEFKEKGLPVMISVTTKYGGEIIVIKDWKNVPMSPALNESEVE